MNVFTRNFRGTEQELKALVNWFEKRFVFVSVTPENTEYDTLLDVCATISYGNY